MVYQGTTYLPVRVVANMLGKEVVYKIDSKTIELNTPKAVQKEAGIPVYDFASQKPELIYGTIQAMEESLKTETNSETIAKFRAYIDGGRAYLKQIGWDDGMQAKLEDQIRIINGQIEAILRTMEIEKDNEVILPELQNDLDKYRAKMTELEARLEALQSDQ